MSVLFLFLWSLVADAQPLEVQSSVLDVEVLIYRDQRPMKVRTLKTGEISFGENKVSLPPQTLIYFFEDEPHLMVEQIVFTQSTKDFSWTLANAKTVSLNCGKRPTSANFVDFDRNGNLIGPCTVNADLSLTPSLKVLASSSVTFRPDGQVLRAQKVWGTLNLENQNVEVLPSSSLYFFEDGEIQAFYPNYGAAFSLMRHPEFLFSQKQEDQHPFIFVFHANGSLESGWAQNTPHEFDFKFGGHNFSFALSTGPVGFNPLGHLDKFIGARTEVLYSNSSFVLERVETQTNLMQWREVQPQETLQIPPKTQYFLSYSQNETAFLRGYAPPSSNGLHHFYTFKPKN